VLLRRGSHAMLRCCHIRTRKTISSGATSRELHLEGERGGGGRGGELGQGGGGRGLGGASHGEGGRFGGSGSKSDGSGGIEGRRGLEGRDRREGEGARNHGALCCLREMLQFQTTLAGRGGVVACKYTCVYIYTYTCMIYEYTYA